MGCNACCPDDGPLQFGDLATDEFCGNFDIACGNNPEDPVTLWSLDDTFFDQDAQTAGTVSVYFEGGCSDVLEVLITRRDLTQTTLFIEPRNTRSISILNLIAVSVACPKGQESSRCRGKYCINLHYDVLVAPGF